MLIAKGYEVTNYGTDSAASVDYPDFDIRWPLMFLKLKQGIVICGSGNGISMTVNKHAKFALLYVG
jgi:ribose 5-phosphate isomerase B